MVEAITSGSLRGNVGAKDKMKLSWLVGFPAASSTMIVLTVSSLILLIFATSHTIADSLGQVNAAPLSSERETPAQRRGGGSAAKSGGGGGRSSYDDQRSAYDRVKDDGNFFGNDDDDDDYWHETKAIIGGVLGFWGGVGSLGTLFLVIVVSQRYCCRKREDEKDGEG